ncbi:hypothetical protein ACFPOI_51355 [Nonomuraea angiospora]|uniref:EVE domain-containing protein n=1 Tax=Nonomuraea angiospora TaxID=46172 RepID=A0ABR9M1K1_9ACTN|nr:hypothetical protein [Nonomuraea angiospora]MBE1586763.1 hypothetical protein [Nonomuraea angiospora]
MSSYLLILGEREAVAWVLRESRMAFPPRSRREVAKLKVGDDMLIVTTRGCWHDPKRDRTRVIGLAEATTSVVAYDEPVKIAGRDFTRGCELNIEMLAPYLTGIELVPLIPQLDAFPDKREGVWPIRLRRPLLEISNADAQLLRQELTTISRDAATVIPEYLASIRPIQPRTRRK